jgi:lipopolysaccharide export system protein LptC
MTGKNVILSSALLITLSLSWWLVNASFIQNHMALPANSPSTPDGFMTEANYTHFDENGDIQNQIYSPKVTHYSENDTSFLTKPSLVMHTLDHQTWIITAENGSSTHGTKEILLKDNVKVERIKVLQNTTSTLTTDLLRAYPDTNLAETDQPVTIIQPGSIVKSIGMTANLKTGDINLLSQAQGVFLPATAKG